jgi:hypothetical protein
VHTSFGTNQLYHSFPRVAPANRRSNLEDLALAAAGMEHYEETLRVALPPTVERREDVHRMAMHVPVRHHTVDHATQTPSFPFSGTETVSSYHKTLSVFVPDRTKVKCESEQLKHTGSFELFLPTRLHRRVLQNLEYVKEVTDHLKIRGDSVSFIGLGYDLSSKNVIFVTSNHRHNGKGINHF